MAREIVNRIQNLRKSKDFEITDRINVKISCSEHVAEAIHDFNDYISKQVLATSINVVDGLENAESVQLDEETLMILIERNLK